MRMQETIKGVIVGWAERYRDTHHISSYYQLLLGEHQDNSNMSEMCYHCPFIKTTLYEITDIQQAARGLPWWLSGKESAYNVGDSGSTLGLGRSPGAGHGIPLQYSSLENPTDCGAWWATIHRMAKSQTRLKQLSTHTITKIKANPSSKS